jgi:hypothetical protein
MWRDALQTRETGRASLSLSDLDRFNVENVAMSYRIIEQQPDQLASDIIARSSQMLPGRSGFRVGMSRIARRPTTSARHPPGSLEESRLNEGACEAAGSATPWDSG